MKKINKTVLLASTLFLTSAINLTDNVYASEDNNSLAKESVDKSSEDSDKIIDNDQEIPEGIKEIEGSLYTNVDYNKEDESISDSTFSVDNDLANDMSNSSYDYKDESTELNLTENEDSDEIRSEDESLNSDLDDENIEEDTDLNNKRIPGVIYYDATSLDQGLNEAKSNPTEIKELYNEQSEISSENYYADNAGGYFVQKNNRINYYKNNKLVRNANIRVNDRIFRADKSGTISNPKNKWLNIGKDIYYNNSEGNILRGINEINKVKFYFSNDGVLERNKKLITQGTYYEVDNAGRMKTVTNTWVNVNNNIYRTLGNGNLAKGITKIGDNDFYFDKSGKLQTNKKLILSNKYYEVNPMGIVTNPKNKWFALDGVSYRTMEDGSLAKGIAEINGNTYVFNYKTGAMITGRPSITNGLYFNINDKGIATLVKDEWVTYEGKTFHTNEAGYVKKGVWEINGNLYCFDGNGLVLNSTYMQNGIEYKTDSKGIAKISGYKVAGDKNIDSIMDWMFNAKNKGMTYDMGAGRGTEKSADCSSAVFRSLIYGGFLKSNAYIGNTETLFSMGANGSIMYEISPSEIDYGDIFVSGVPGKSLGDGGHTGFILNKNQDTIIHMNYSGNGVTITPRVGHMGDKSGRPVKYFRLRNATSKRIFVDKK